MWRPRAFARPGAYRVRGGGFAVVQNDPACFESYHPDLGIELRASPAALVGGDLRAHPASTALAAWLTGASTQVLHAGAIAYEGAAALVIGASGAGKSTTVLACAMAGACFLGDDLILVESAGDDDAEPTVHCLFATLKLNTDSARALGAEAWPSLGVTSKNKAVIAVGQKLRVVRSARIVALIVLGPPVAGRPHPRPIKMANVVTSIAPGLPWAFAPTLPLLGWQRPLRSPAGSRHIDCPSVGHWTSLRQRCVRSSRMPPPVDDIALIDCYRRRILMKCAIATVAIGEDYQSSYTSIFKPSVQRYVDRHKYDLFIFNDYIGDHKHRDPHLVTFMKMLVPYQEVVQGHDLLMVLDVDILIGAKTPPFHALDLGSKIGVVDEWCQPTREERVKFQVANGLETSASDYYHLAGFALESEILINSGMFICAPRKHAAFFREIVGSTPRRSVATRGAFTSNKPCLDTSSRRTTSHVFFPSRGTAFGLFIGARPN